MKLCTILVALASAVSLATPTDAAITVNINEVGSDVIAIGTGSLDLTGLTYQGLFFGGPQSIHAPSATVLLGVRSDVNQDDPGYSGLVGPSSFGPGNAGCCFGSGGTGDDFGIVGNRFGPTYVFFSYGYQSGSVLSGSALFLGQSFASLGITPGQYVYLAPNDTFTVNIGPISDAVPEPSSWVMMLLGFGVLGFALRRHGRSGLRYPHVA
jgi:hypothetical protein